ncbi:MAG: hypothetical protein ABSG65_15665 [Bryobacteraceae bacterium]
MAVGKQGFVKIQDKVLSGGISNRPYTKHRDTEPRGGLRNPPSLHFHSRGSASPQKLLFGRSLRHMADRSQNAGGVRDFALRHAQIEPAALCLDRLSHENISDTQRWVQRTTESHTDDRIRQASRIGNFDRFAGMRRACSIRHHPQLPAAGFAESCPIDRPAWLTHVRTKPQQPVELAGLRGH